MELPDPITIQCDNCFEMIDTSFTELREDDRLSCYHCFHVQLVDVDKLLEGMSEIMKKVHDRNKVANHKSVKRKSIRDSKKH